MAARYVEENWEKSLAEKRAHADKLWDDAEALSFASGFNYKDRKGRWQYPNPARQEGLVELAMKIYNKGLVDGDFEQPFKPLCL